MGNMMNIKGLDLLNLQAVCLKAHCIISIHNVSFYNLFPLKNAHCVLSN